MYSPTICQAIDSRRLLQFYYNDYTERTVEPHAYGINHGQREVLLAYQVAGATLSGEPAGLRLFVVVEMSHLTLLEESFSEPREGYARDNRFMHRIFCQL
jgi:hypothetical protein